jgi:hypothetical protein
MERSSPIPDFLLERYSLGELSPAECDRIRSSLENNADLQARLAEIEASNAEILERHPVREVSAEIRQRAQKRKIENAQKSFRPWGLIEKIRQFPSMMIPALVTTAAALLIFVHIRPAPFSSMINGFDSLDTTRSKGIRPHLAAYLVRNGKAERLSEGALVHAADTVQLRYVSAGKQYGVVVSIDGAGGVTLHLPEKENEVVKLAAQGETALPSAFVLDEAPGYERFFLIVSDRPFLLKPVLEAARSLASRSNARDRLLELPASLEQFSLTLQKESL